MTFTKTLWKHKTRKFYLYYERSIKNSIETSIFLHDVISTTSICISHVQNFLPFSYVKSYMVIKLIHTIFTLALVWPIKEVSIDLMVHKYIDNFCQGAEIDP